MNKEKKEYTYNIGNEEFTTTQLMDFFLKKAEECERKKGFWKSNYPTRYSYSYGFWDGVLFGTNLMASVAEGDGKYSIKSNIRDSKQESKQ